MNHQMVILMFTKVTVLFLSIVVIIAHMVHRFLPGHLHWNLHHHMVTPRVPRLSLLSKTVAHKGAAIWPGISNSAPTWRYPPSKPQHWWNPAANCDAVSCNWNQLDSGKKWEKKTRIFKFFRAPIWCSVDALLTVIWLLLICWCAWICLWLNMALGFVPASWDSWGPCKQSHSWTVGCRRVCKDLSSDSSLYHRTTRTIPCSARCPCAWSKIRVLSVLSFTT